LKGFTDISTGPIYVWQVVKEIDDIPEYFKHVYAHRVINTGHQAKQRKGFYQTQKCLTFKST